MTLDLALGAVVTVFILGYLIFALIRPEPIWQATYLRWRGCVR